MAKVNTHIISMNHRNTIVSRRYLRPPGTYGYDELAAVRAVDVCEQGTSRIASRRLAYLGTG